MVHLSQEAEAFATRIAARAGVPVDAAIRRALESEARRLGLPAEARSRRMSAQQMLAAGAEIAALPVLDPRAPREIMDDVSSPSSSSTARL